MNSSLMPCSEGRLVSEAAGTGQKKGGWEDKEVIEVSNSFALSPAAVHLRYEGIQESVATKMR